MYHFSQILPNTTLKDSETIEIRRTPRASLMPKNKDILAQLFVACWKDEALKARFMAAPKAVLAEHGMAVPDGLDVKVVENTDNCVHITIPLRPSGDLSDVFWTIFG